MYFVVQEKKNLKEGRKFREGCFDLLTDLSSKVVEESISEEFTDSIEKKKNPVQANL